MRRSGSLSGSLGIAGVLCALGAAAPAPADGPWATDPVHVYYPRGDCRGAELDLEVWDRERAAWRPHPTHPRIPLESCQLEDAGNLFNEIRFRCVEPPESRPPPAWVVGLEVFDPQVMETCAPEQLALPGGNLELDVVAPAPGERVAAPRMEVAVQGSVRMDGIEGSDYDLELVIDRSSDAREDGVDLLAAQVRAARALVDELAPRLGPVRIGVTAYPNMPPLPGASSGTGARRVAPLGDDPAALRRALGELGARGPSGFPTFGSAFDFALAELAGEHADSGARPRARKVLVIAADAAGASPFGPAAARDPRLRAQLEERLDRAREAHVALHVFALGGISEELPDGTRELFDLARAHFHRVLRPALGDAFFAHVPLPQLTGVVVANRTTGGDETPARILGDGRFTTTLAASAGTNRLWARATLSDGATAEREWAFEFDDSIVREQLLAAEREHMRRVREKRLELHPLWGELVPPEETDDVAAPPAE